MNNHHLNDFLSYLNSQKRYSQNTISSYKRDLNSFFNYLKKENMVYLYT